VTSEFGADIEAERAFERLLLGAARVDAVPEAKAREAWVRFERSSLGLALAVSSTPKESLLLHALRGSSLKWLVAGALGGAAVTLAVLSRNVPERPLEATLGVMAQPPKVEPVVQREAAREPPEVAPSGEGKRDVAAPQPGTATAKRAPTAIRRAANAQLSGPKASSTLAAEIAALDSIRLAISVGAYGQALRAVDKYHSDFPKGQLARDADVLAVEVLRAQGERAEAARRTTKFLERYPNDLNEERLETWVSDPQ
jgi:hypothetical protein